MHDDDDQARSLASRMDPGAGDLAATSPTASTSARTELQRLAAFCRQTAADGILPSLAWFTETADVLENHGVSLDALVVQWEQRVKTMRRDAAGTLLEPMIAKRADAFEECGRQLSALRRP